jgi:hypothetical protein
MTTPAEAAQNSVKIGRKHILDQQLRIARQRALMGELEGDGHSAVLANARRALIEMEQMLVQMELDYAAAQERLAQATMDKASLAKVERDTAM